MSIKSDREAELYEAGYNKGLKDAYERVLIKFDIIDNPNKIIRLYPQDKEEEWNFTTLKDNVT